MQEQENPSAAHEMVMDAIITQKLAPSQKVSENVFTDMFDISRSTARNIIEQLTAQQFLVSISPRVTRVAPLTLVDIKQNFAVRKLLEPSIFSMAAAQVDIATMNQLGQDMAYEGPIDDDTTALRLLKANKRSNLYLVENVRYPLLTHWVGQLEDMAMRIYWLYLKMMRTFPYSWENQRRMIEALRSDDADAVQQHTLAMLNACEERVMRAIFMHDQLNTQDLHLPQ